MTDSKRVALVTGTSSGIGAVLAEALLKDGWAVVGMARRHVAMENPAYRHIETDLGDLTGLQSVTDQQLAPLLNDMPWQRIALVNNAAMIGAMRGLEAMDPGQLAGVFAVNTIAPMLLMGFVTRAASPTASLRIVNVSTGAAVRPFPGLGDYGSSKAALRMAGMILAEELSSDARPGGRRADAAILSYEPGVVDTAMQVEARSSTAEEFPWNQPFREFAAQGMLERPEDVIGEILAFLSGDAGEPFVERRYGAP